MDKLKEFLKTKKGKIIAGISLATVVIVVAVLVLLLTKSDQKGYRTISVSEIVGTVTAENNGKTYDAYANMKLKEGYALSTKSDSYVRMVLDADKYIKLEENSKAKFTSLDGSNSGYTVINLEYGAITNEIASSLSEDEDYIINTPNAVLAVRGTFFRVEVVLNEKGETLTDVYTYGGSVKSQRVLPSGEKVEEDVQVDGGYKTTISMNAEETIYVVERVEEGKENTEPFTLADVPEADLVDMYVASMNGHKMFVETEDIWYGIESRDIDVDDYTSSRDGEKVPVYEGEVSHTHTEKSVTKQATCTEAGYTNVICTVCGETVSETQIPTTGHTEKETTKDATCTEGGYTRVECTECGQIMSEVTTPALGHDEVTTTVEPSGTTAGKTTVSCARCEAILSEVEIPVGHVHTMETITMAPTCTTTGKEVIRCSVCLEVSSEKTIAATGHTEKESTVEPTFIGMGTYRKYCSVCDTTLEYKTIDSLPAIYTDDGDIYITAMGYYQGTKDIMYHFTGDYYIAQKSSSPVNCTIYIEDGAYTVNIDAINISGGIKVSRNGEVIVYGTNNTSYIKGTKAIENEGVLQFSSGRMEITGSEYGIECMSGNTTIVVGSYVISGGTADIHCNETYIIGGSVKLANGKVDGSIVNASYILECITFDNMPDTNDLTFMSSSSNKYVYKLNPEDKAADGKYYVWKPKNFINITESNFPDDAFRNFINSSIDANKDGYLSTDEVNQVEVILLPESLGLVGSLKGVEYFTSLKTLQSDCSLAITSLDLSQNTQLEGLFISGAPIVTLDLSNNPKLRSIDVSGTNLYMLNVSSQKDTLEYLYCQDSSITYLDLSECSKLTTLNIANCPMACVNLEGTNVSESTLTAGNNTYYGGSYAMVTPNMADMGGIDISKVYSLSGADFDEMSGTLTAIEGLVQYKYECGNGISREFAIRFD